MFLPMNSSGKSGPCLVLAVDDDPLVLAALEALLTVWGCDVAAAGSLQEALAMVAVGGRPPDALVVDYRLQDGTTGLMVMDELRKRLGAEIPAVVVTDDTLPDRLREIVANGVPVLHKPVNPSRLEAVVMEMCRRCADAP